MKVTIIGAGGKIGQRIVKEAAQRNHELKLITSKSKDFFDVNNATVAAVDIFNEAELANALKGSDVVISAYGPPEDNPERLIDATKHLLVAAKKADVRLIAVGGAGSLQVGENTQLVDTPDFPEDYKAIATVHREALETLYYKENDLKWTNVSPSAYIFEGEKTGKFRIGHNDLLADAEGNSSISMEDFAIGILNEVENSEFIKKRFTIGY